MPDHDETRKRLPTGTLPIDQTKWSGDHRQIKLGTDAAATDRVFIDPNDGVWLENPDGTFTYNGAATAYTGSGKAQGRLGTDRARKRRSKPLGGS